MDEKSRVSTVAPALPTALNAQNQLLETAAESRNQALAAALKE
jgi:hypothetical protein